MTDQLDSRWTGPADRIGRLVEIHRLLVRGDERLTAAALAARMGVHTRTIRRDLRFLRDRLGAPIGFDRSGLCYRYTEEFHMLPELFLSHGELSLAMALAQRFPGLPVLTRLVEKLTRGLDGPRLARLREQSTRWLPLL